MALCVSRRIAWRRIHPTVGRTDGCDANVGGFVGWLREASHQTTRRRGPNWHCAYPGGLPGAESTLRWVPPDGCDVTRRAASRRVASRSKPLNNTPPGAKLALCVSRRIAWRRIHPTVGSIRRLRYNA
nr:hypothetical protein [Methylomarinum sp. Ch1-1]MDP4521249.1 hypothetical protein [Methylomarinum sp. Ch1-1]